MQRNLMDKIYKALLLFPQTITATGNSASQDVKDLMSLTFLLSVGTMAFTGTDKLTVKLQESDDNSSWTDCTVANGAAYEDDLVLDSGTEDESLFALEYRGSKRYARVAYTEGGTVSVAMSVTAIGLSKVQPPA